MADESRRPPRAHETARPLLSLSLDLDNKWSYLKTHGDAGWDAFPSYLEPLADIAPVTVTIASAPSALSVVPRA